MTVDDISRVAPRLPRRQIISQRWSDLAFLHWRVDPGLVAPHLPRGVRPDVFDGSSWVGLIPFELSRAAFGPLPPVPYLGRFAETNVRLYGVGDDGRRSVVFRTLEASKLLPVLTARLGLGLPYTWSSMSIVRGGGTIAYESTRRWPRADGPELPSSRVVIRPATAPADDGLANDPLAQFLTARWGMHVGRGGRTLYWPNAHDSWSLRSAELLELDDELLEATGFRGLASRPPDSVLYSPGVDTVFATGRRLPSRGV